MGGLTQSLRQQLISPAWQRTTHVARLPDALQGWRTADRHAAAQSQPLHPVWLCPAEAWHLPLPATYALVARLLSLLGLSRLLLLLLGQQIRLQPLASLQAAVLK